ncbi:hypothetical protein Pcinc_042114, partial [Petrolisthes cinctipes]
MLLMSVGVVKMSSVGVVVVVKMMA